MSRNGTAVASTTSKKEGDNILRLLGWLVHEKKLARPTLHAFGALQIGPAVQLYVKFLVEVKGRKYSTIANYVASYIAAARFVHARHLAASAGSVTTSVRSTKPIDDLKSLHMQLKQQGRKEATFDITKPTNGTQPKRRGFLLKRFSWKSSVSTLERVALSILRTSTFTRFSNSIPGNGC